MKSIDATRSKNFKHLMVDIETMGNQSYSAIASIGAIEFDPARKLIGDSFYVVVDLESCLKAGLIVNASTLYWWLQQNEEARLELAASEKISIQDALTSFNTFMYDTDYEIWARSPRFDLGILQNAYNKLGWNIPWNFRKERCVRTVEQYCIVDEKWKNPTHQALSDCMDQIAIVSTFYNTLPR